MNIQFGSGVLFAVPTAGNLATNPTPYKLGVLQEAQVAIKGDLKKLYGQKQFPVAKARGKIDVSVKAKLAALDPNMINQLFFAQTAAVGMTQIADDEAQAVPGTPYTVTVTNATTFVRDYGVRLASNGNQLTRVTTGPATGQYSVTESGANKGKYVFAAADTLLNMLISYAYTQTTTGTTITLSNQLMGFAPEFCAFLYNTFRTKFFGLELYNCTASEIGIPTKQEDFWVVDINFDACTDATDTLGKLYADNF